MKNLVQIVGADLSKRFIDLVIHSSKNHLRIDNTPEGFRKMIAWFKQSAIHPSQILLVMEFTGLYSYCFEKFLFEKNILFSKVNPVDIKYSIGITRGKSDKIDAGRIARYGVEQSDRLKIQTQGSKALENLKMLNTSREKLVRTRAGLKTSSEEFRNIGMKDNEPALRGQLKVIKSLDKEILMLENQIQATLSEHREISKNFELLRSISGVGPVIALNAIIKTGNFTRFQNSRKFACYCGIAPFEHSSGTSVRGKTRVSHMADKGMKALLDLAAKAAVRCDPELKAFFERRTSLGKSKMSTINIVRNKIVGRMFAVIQSQSQYKKVLSKAA